MELTLNKGSILALAQAQNKGLPCTGPRLETTQLLYLIYVTDRNDRANFLFIRIGFSFSIGSANMVDHFCESRNIRFAFNLSVIDISFLRGR